MTQLNNLLPRGGALSVLNFEIIREVPRDELMKLVNLPALAPPPIKTLSARHRRQAQLLAEGKPPAVVADALGVTPQRISQLLKDPSFVQLIAEYEDEIKERFFAEQERLQAKLLVAGETALDEINNRLEGDKPSSEVPYGELRKTVEMAMDRTVAPPKTANNQQAPPPTITLNFGRTLTPRIIDPDGHDE